MARAALIASLLLLTPITHLRAWAGGPPEDIQQQRANNSMKVAWTQDVIQTAREQGIPQTDLGMAILHSIVKELGVWKVIAVLFLFLLASVGGVIFAVLKFFQRKT